MWYNIIILESSMIFCITLTMIVLCYQVQFILEVKVCKMDSKMCGLVEQPWL